MLHVHESWRTAIDGGARTASGVVAQAPSGFFGRFADGATPDLQRIPLREQISAMVLGPGGDGLIGHQGDWPAAGLALWLRSSRPGR